MGNAILVWPYSEAPDEMRLIADELYQAEDDDGDDEQCDWIAFIPRELESFKKGFVVDWDGEVESAGSRVRQCEAFGEDGGFILAGKFTEKLDGDAEETDG